VEDRGGDGQTEHSRLPDDGGGIGVAAGLAEELHVGAAHVPVVVVAHDGHLGRVWGEGRATAGEQR